MTVSEAPLDVIPNVDLLIGDTRIADSSGGFYEHVYAATGKASATVPLAGRGEIDAAVLAARTAFPAWRALSVAQRRTLMNRLAGLVEQHSDELVRMAVLDSAVPIGLGGGAARAAADLISYNAGWADKVGGEVVNAYGAPSVDYAIDEPYGVVGIIIPWNAPLIACAMVLGPSLAAGNCVVLKPPEVAPYVSLRIGELALEAGFPPGVLNVVPAGPAGGDALVRHRDIDKVHFTGSGPTARKVLAAALETLKPVGLELGGKSANLIFPDADLQKATQQAVFGILNLSGQGCINGTRALVHRSVYDDVVDLAASMAKHLPIGDPLEPANLMGPVINEVACDRIVGVIEQAERSGARLVAGGSRMGGEYADGYFIQPTVFADVAPGSALGQNEVFGPVLAIIPFEDEDEAVHIANSTEFGLAAYIQTNDLGRAHRVAGRLEAGNVWVNGFAGIPAGAPFGGTKQSGFGRLGGIWGIREFTRPKNIWISLG